MFFLFSLYTRLWRLFILNIDQVSEANKSYKELHGGSFQFEHCWNILKDQPKWHIDVEKKTPKKNKTWIVPSSSTPELVDLGECDATIVDLRDL
ncbi:hypothetical protein RHMOL_Rhmol12G0097000 [Rhododendron molle]|uniref:Uncharacterized protein n=1 Tax=Rhododendron molle TaxID=49168 RepID=A0ACC0LGD3_RHOML|nr:hypothetical protein RHMOL_Rhmol12G0097000 [Rhododendron molle]